VRWLPPATAALLAVWLLFGRGWAVALLVACLVPLWLNRGDTRAERRRRPWTRIEREIVLGRAGYQCQDCGSRYELEVDHYVPWARGGAHDLSNARCLCGPCNRRKSDTPPEEYYR
jgi:5-methylcytosine-specific restriction endonuclease McrA